MFSVIETILLGMASVLFVAAAVMVFRHVRRIPLREEGLLLAADAASYASKQEGGDRIMVGRKVEG